MLAPKLRRQLRLERLAFLLAGLSFGLLTSILANWLSAQWTMWIPVVAVVAVLSGILGAYLYLRKPPGSEWVIRAPVTIRSEEEATRYARRAYVGFVPLFNPQKGSPANQLNVTARKTAAEALDFDQLDIEHSNFQPTVVAITAHTSRLEHCWLLATVGRDMEGSLPYARLMAEYLKQVKGVHCEFHYDEPYCVPLDDDALVLNKTYDRVRQVLAEAESLGIGPDEIVADITTGTRSMSLGIVLTCLDRDHDIQFVGTRYDGEGTPVGDPFPILFSVEATNE